MKYIKIYLSEIKKQINFFGGFMIMLDFDGTISPICPTPDEAYFPERNKFNLEIINRLFPVAIISGRALEDIKQKIGVNNFIYSGSHGLEWNIPTLKKSKHVPIRILKILKEIKIKIKKLLPKYPGMIIEDKPFTLPFHYRLIKPGQVPIFKSDIAKILKPIYKDKTIRVIDNKKTIELVPNLNWDKGDIVKLIYKYLKDRYQTRLVPIYIGDSLTDEDAFKALKDGITIRVRPKKGSSAKYYLKSRAEVDRFIVWLASYCKEIDVPSAKHQ